MSERKQVIPDSVETIAVYGARLEGFGERRGIVTHYDSSKITFTWGGVSLTGSSEGTFVEGDYQTMNSSGKRTGRITIKLVRSGRRYQIRLRARARKKRRGW